MDLEDLAVPVELVGLVVQVDHMYQKFQESLVVSTTHF